jgi:lipopolysaccharide/colanic/teichoic acid biosynthesis glycosyltransferase
MGFFPLVKMKRYFARPSKTVADMGIHPQWEFRKILKRECARADRVGSHLALIRFSAGRSKDGDRLHAGLIDLLHKRIRLTDDLGWLEDQRVGLLLFHTNARNAYRFLSGLKRNGCDILSNYSCDIYTYPQDKSDDTGFRAGPRRGKNVFQSPDRHARRNQIGTSTTASRTRQWKKFAEPRRNMTTVEKTIPGSIKGIVLRTPLWKRILDVSGATIALAVFSPLFLIVAIYIKCVSQGPVFFKQARIGYRGDVFRMWKFRTMHTDADQDSHLQLISDLLKNNDQPMKKLADDPRLIPLGSLLRKFCIDELPQLINVLMGEMSLVGPRPDPVYAIENYIHWYADRFDTMPGMTGLWQISGKNRLSFQQMMRLDIAYARKQSIWLDLKILFNTVPAILSNAKYDA